MCVKQDDKNSRIQINSSHFLYITLNLFAKNI